MNRNSIFEIYLIAKLEIIIVLYQSDWAEGVRSSVIL